MKLWIDDVRPAPEGYIWLKTVNDAKNEIIAEERMHYDPFDNYHPWNIISIIDIGHDAGDYIKLLDWLEETGRNYPIRIHSMNPVGLANMRQIIERNGWKEVK